MFSAVSLLENKPDSFFGSTYGCICAELYEGFDLKTYGSITGFAERSRAWNWNIPWFPPKENLNGLLF